MSLSIDHRFYTLKRKNNFYLPKFKIVNIKIVTLDKEKSFHYLAWGVKDLKVQQSGVFHLEQEKNDWE